MLCLKMWRLCQRSLCFGLFRLQLLWMELVSRMLLLCVRREGGQQLLLCLMLVLRLQLFCLKLVV